MRSKEVYYCIEYEEPDKDTGTVCGMDILTTDEQQLDFNELTKEPNTNDCVTGLEELPMQPEV